MLPIVDTHQHLWDLSKFSLPWTDSSPKLGRSFVTRDYLEATAGSNVVKAVYMEVDVSPEQQVKEAEHVIALSQSDEYPTVGAVISGRPMQEDFVAYLDRFKDSQYVKGIRQVLHGSGTPAGFCLQEDFVRGMHELGQRGLSFDLCLRPAELNDGWKLADLCPETQFILDHCGNADPNVINGDEPIGDGVYAHSKEQWMDDIAALGERANVVCKISGVVARVRPGWSEETLPQILQATVDHCLNSFGPDRVIFGGDWPVCTLGAPYQDWADALRKIIANRPEEEQRKLLAENAEQLYAV